MTDEIKKEQAAVRSFRVTDGVMGRFKELQDEMGLTQDGALKTLVDAYELEKAKNAIPDREMEIANFQTKASELVEAFLHSLQLNQDAEARIRNDFVLKLECKDTTIAELQEKNRKKQEEISNAKENELRAEARLLEAEKTMNAALRDKTTAEKTAKDKEAITTMYQTQLQDALGKLDELPIIKAKNEDLSRQLSEAIQTIKDAKKDGEFALERLYIKTNSEIETQKAIVVEKEKYIEKLEDKIEKLQEKLVDLKEEVAELKSEKKQLKKELEKRESDQEHLSQND